VVGDSTARGNSGNGSGLCRSCGKGIRSPHYITGLCVGLVISYLKCEFLCLCRNGRRLHRGQWSKCLTLAGITVGV
jgi:hypothetical protein